MNFLKQPNSIELIESERIEFNVVTTSTQTEVEVLRDLLVTLPTNGMTVVGAPPRPTIIELPEPTMFGESLVRKLRQRLNSTQPIVSQYPH